MAAYVHEIVDGAIAIDDCSAIERNRSVRNSIERVPAEVTAKVGGLKDHPAICRNPTAWLPVSCIAMGD